jgi:hypothetical protein
MTIGRTKPFSVGPDGKASLNLGPRLMDKVIKNNYMHYYQSVFFLYGENHVSHLYETKLFENILCSFLVLFT